MKCLQLLIVTIFAFLLTQVVVAQTDIDRSDEDRQNIELMQELDARGGFVRIEGDSLFLTSDVRKGEQTGYWFDLAAGPLRPSLVRDRLPGAWDVAVHRDHAIVCDYKKHLTVYRLHDKSWALSANLEMPSMTENVVLRDKLAYVACHTAGMIIVDISQPDKPSVVGTINPKIDCDAIGLSGNIAILYGHWESRLALVDISDPKHPKEIGVYQGTPRTFNQGELAIDGGIAFCTTQTGLVIVDCSNPAEPKLLHDVKLGGAITDVEVLDNYAFIAAGSRGVIVLDVSNPTAPVVAGRYASDTTLSASQIAVKQSGQEDDKPGDYIIYAANRKGAAIVLKFSPKVQNPSNE